MTKQELVDYCSEKVSDIRKELLVEDPEYEFYIDFFSNYSIKSVKGIISIPSTDIVTAYLNAVLDKPFSEVGEDVSSFSYIFERFTYKDLAILRMALDVLHEGGSMNFENIKKACSTSNSRKGYQFIFTNGEDELMDAILKKLLDINSRGFANLVKFLEYYEAYPETMDFLIHYVGSAKEIEELYETAHQMTVDATRGLSGMNKKRNNKVVSMFMKDAVDQKGFVEAIKVIDEYYSNLNSTARTNQRKLEKAEKAYLEFIKKLPKIFSSVEIKDYQAIIKDIPDEEVKLEFLKLVYEHNMECYDKTMATYNELSKNSSVSFLTLLQGYGISKDEVRLSSIMKNNYDDVVKMIKLLRGLSDDKKIVIKGLETSKLIDILYLKELKDKGVLSKESIVTNLGLFNSESDVRKMLDENIKGLNGFGLNPSILGLNQEVLLESELLKSNLNVLKEYDLLKYLKGQNNYSFLGSEGLASKIDKFLELGYEKYIKEDITLLNEDNIDRIYVLKSIGIVPETKEELLEYLRTDRFLVADDKLNNYIHNVVDYVKDDFKLDIDSIISEYDSTNRTIDINGVVLSKNRIRRNKETGDFKSIITGSILSIDEVDSLKTELKEKELIKNS